ncbi:MAG: sigma 54-interacting transcriptional regulator [Methylobacter sp.]|uniref:sigma-54-dependent transcriptional regulator n=1 Tax=Methylobacter sp. TaxID=2051955 RepID=UPI002588108F|nr:sigma 54-interacting transcriptional regulator [Methylobacter sp.]MCL7422025.1 sigma 54-interacting transcriptional regulator [Methylobacter sp.]
MKKLLPEQRDFFRQIADLAFVNPFSRERELADWQLLNRAPGGLDLSQRAEEIQPLLRERLQQLQPLSDFRITVYQGKVREIMEYAWLFYQFHEFQDRFNQFIVEQERAGDEPLELPFAAKLTGCFQRAGFGDAACAKYIALFYQLQRGFYFINSSVSGDCSSIVELRMRLWNNIFTFNPHWYLNYLLGRMEEFSTLLLGATGSGKSLVARAIGCSGFIPFDLKRRRFQESFTRSFQAINLAQFPASLLESELFGHKKGAFTGAIENHPGVFARCSANGAVFIDEIGDIDIPTQVKLLNVIQDRAFSPVGSHEKLRFSGRVISATNRDIEQLRRDGLFRDDLYYRLCSDVIVVPGLQQRLRENPAELTPLIAGLLKRVIDNPDRQLVARMETRIRAMVPEQYAWPGNVRELEQCIRRICLTGSYSVAEKNQLAEGQAFGLPESGAEPSAQELLRHYCRFLYEKHGSYEAVARITRLDRRTARKYVVG